MTKRFIKLSGIYAIVNIFNDKRYVGSAIDLRKRWEFHKWQLNCDKHNNKYLQRSWNKYLSVSFIFVVLEYVDKENLVFREQFWLDNLKPEYNILPKAHSTFGRILSAESRAKMSAWQIGKTISPEHREKMAAAKRGVSLSEEHKLKLSISGKNVNGKYKRSKETIERMATSLRDFKKWPCSRGSKCTCEICLNKKQIMRRERNKALELGL